MKKIFSIFLVLAACQQVPQNSEEDHWLFKVSGETVSSKEFQYAFEKNNFEKDSINTEDEIREYLELYTNFKLKVREAKALGMDTSSAYKQELEGYRKQLAGPYLTESAVTEQLIKEAYNRMGEEIRASHILIISRPETSPEDTVKNYQLVEELRNRALSGEDFNSLARQYSQDPSAKRNSGDLGFFSAFQMVYPFESAAYNTPVDSISDIVKTQFGYHILKVTARRKTRGQVKVSHIMIRATDNLSAEDSTKAKQKIDEIYAQLQNDGNWRDLCREFSQDSNTRNTGGQLPWLGSGNVPLSFENAAFSLEENGDISAPVKTSFGWHVIKLDGKKNLQPFEEMQDELQTRIQRDSRSELSSKAFYQRVKRENEFKENSDAKKYAISILDSTLLQAAYIRPEEMEDTELFRLQSRSFPVSGFLKFVEDNQRKSREKDVSMLGNRYYEQYLEKSLTEFEESQLPEKYFDYRMLYQEYAEGIMLFQLMDEKIWSGVLKDSTGIQNYYEEHSSDYMLGERLSATIYNASNDSIRSVIVKMTENSDSLLQSKKELNSYFNEKSSLNLQTWEGLLGQSDPVYQELPQKSPGSYTFELNNRFYFVIVDKIIPPEPEALDNIRGQVISDYQEDLEIQWIEELREKYEVEINEKELENLINELAN